MAVPITVPGVGESITEGIIAKWLKANGSAVKSGEPLFELETDKASNTVPAAASGVLTISVPEGETVAIGATVGSIDPAGQPAEPSSKPKEDKAAKPEPTAQAKPAPAPTNHANGGPASTTDKALSPAVRRIVTENDLDPSKVEATGPGGRLTKGDLLQHLQTAPAQTVPSADSQPAAGQAPAPSSPTPRPAPPSGERETRQRMSGLRQKIAQRLVEVQQTAAILTTFNEADLSKVMDLRAKYKESFKTKHGVGLGFMSFFVKAVIQALKEFPAVNARIDGTDIVYNNYHDIGIAVSTERGLMVPVLRDADALSFADIEKGIVGFADKAKKGTISVDDLRGGTFTITNGGTFGSLLSTPILNPPQSGILGMHAIKKRPVVVDDQIVIRPMMYLALSYDHRIIDGREAVSFLVRVKEGIEDPERLMLAV